MEWATGSAANGRGRVALVSSAIAHERLRERLGGVWRIGFASGGWETRANSDLEFAFLALEKFIGLGSDQSRQALL